MSWYSTNSESFPAAVQRALLPEHTTIHECYTIEKALCVCGTELCYLAADSRTDEKIILHEILPIRWCMRDENGNWVPRQTDSENAFEAVKADCLKKLGTLQKLHEESALDEIPDIFEEMGTIWFTTKYMEQVNLFQVINGTIYSPQEAIDLLAPVMDTLVGLHADSIVHGSVSAQSIVLHDENAVLTGWCTVLCGEEVSSITATQDVQAVSKLLYRMMTGEQIYNKETAAALPSGIRHALRAGMESTDMTMEQLWITLHKDRAVKRSRKLSHSSGDSALFSKRFTAVFCCLCLVVPLLLGAFVMFGSRLKDAEYTLADHQIRVPELLYMSQEDAVAAANSLKLHVIIAAREDNPVIEENHVVTQNPSAGAILKAGDTVQLTISDGWANYVPNVCNMMLEDAQKTLEDLGFIVEYEEILSAGDAPGTVISQDISPEKLLERDSVIKLKVSLGRKDVDRSKYELVDNYVGMQFDEVKSLLSDLYLYALQAEAVYDRNVPEGCIIEQNIPEGKRVPQGTIIEMKVSLGVETVRVPHVVLMNSATAKGMLERLRLKPVLVYAASKTYVTDSVISQNVSSGKLVPVGSEIWLTVSSGKPSTVISTGGWSGDPLPTVDITEDTTDETLESQTEETDTSETDSTEESTAESTGSTEASDSTETTAASVTKSTTDSTAGTSADTIVTTTTAKTTTTKATTTTTKLTETEPSKPETTTPQTTVSEANEN